MSEAGPSPNAPLADSDPTAPPGRSAAQAWIKGLTFVAVLVAAILVARLETIPFTDRPNPLRKLTDLEQARDLREDIRRGVAGPVLFVAAYVLACVMFLPTVVMSVLGGATFGLWPGILYIWLGANLGAVATFYLARLLGRDLVGRLAGRWLDWLNVRAKQHGFVLILYARLLGLPFTPVNYASGMAEVRVRDLVLGTGLGILPFSGLFAYFGESLVEGAGAETYVRLAVLAAATMFLIGLPAAIRRRRALRAAAAGSPASTAADGAAPDAAPRTHGNAP